MFIFVVRTAVVEVVFFCVVCETCCFFRFPRFWFGLVFLKEHEVCVSFGYNGLACRKFDCFLQLVKILAAGFFSHVLLGGSCEVQAALGVETGAQTATNSLGALHDIHTCFVVLCAASALVCVALVCAAFSAYLGQFSAGGSVGCARPLISLVLTYIHTYTRSMRAFVRVWYVSFVVLPEGGG